MTPEEQSLNASYPDGTKIRCDREMHYGAFTLGKTYEVHSAHGRNRTQIWVLDDKDQRIVVDPLWFTPVTDEGAA